MAVRRFYLESLRFLALLAFVLTNASCMRSCNSHPSGNSAGSSTITGTVLPFAGLVQNHAPGSFEEKLYAALLWQNAVAAGCTATASVYALSKTTGDKTGSPLASAILKSDTSFTFLDAIDKGIKLDNAQKIEYIIEVSGCGIMHQRHLTSDKTQVVSSASSFLTYAARAGGTTKFTDLSKSAVEALMNKLPCAAATTELDVYNYINANAAVKAEFESLFGILLTDMLTASPRIYSVTAPTTINEATLSTYSVTPISHFNAGYSVVYLWKLDGANVATTSSYAYTPSANAQGSHTIAYWVGVNDGGGNVDLAKPYQTGSYTVTVTNSSPPTPPALSLVTPATPYVTTTNLTLQIATGAAMANCASFSTLAITENSAVAPAAGAFTITCSAAPTQNIAYNLTTAGEGAKTLRLWARDASGNVSSTATSTAVVYDITPPTFTAGGMSVNSGSASTTNNNVLVNLAATDSYTNITHFCLRYNNTAAPAAADPCWVSVTATPPNLALSSSLALSAYPFLIGFTGGVYTVYAWAKDAAGNISTLTNAGAGTDSRDRDAITYSPSAPPTLSDILVANTATPANPPSVAELTIPSGNTVHIHWKATDDFALPASPISLYYTTDDVNYSLIASGLSNGSNGGCTVNNGGTTADDNATGCYTWTGGSPTNNYYKIRVGVVDSNSSTTYGTSTSINALVFKFLAGNTDPGLGGSAISAMFFSNMSVSSTADPNSFAVKNDGTIFFRDINRGILKVNPATGLQTLYIATTGASTGDGGAATSATLRSPGYIALDYSERLLIFDYDRIRRVDAAGNISTIIGGGADAVSDTVAPLTLSISPKGYNSAAEWFGSFFPLPNGDIYFQSETQNDPARRRIRYYQASSGLVKSLYFTGTSDQSGATTISDCATLNLGFEFNPSTSVITGIIGENFHSAIGGPGCTAGGISGVAYDATGLATPPHPAQFYLASRVQGRDGKIYGISRYNGGIYRYDSVLVGWTLVVGTGTGRGYCADGTAATSCMIDVQDAFVTSTGKIYFADRGRIRYVDDSGNVYTVVGQSFSFGDGGSALSARFGKVNDIGLWSNVGTDTVISLDQQEMRLREFPIDGNISTIAGNGTDAVPNTVANANAQSITISGSGEQWDYFSHDPATGDVYMSRDFNHIGKINRATGKWVDLVGGGVNVYTAPGADGTASIDLVYSYYSLVLGFDGTSLMAIRSQYSAGFTDSMMKLYNVTTGVQSHLAGITGATAGAYCANGTALNACVIPYANGQVHIDSVYDSFSSRWIAGTWGGNSIKILVPGGNMAELVALPRVVRAIAYRHDAGNDVIYYCANANNRLYKYDLNTTTETALSWPISTMDCDGRAMTYSTARNSLVFIYKQNNLYGIAEYLNP